MGSVSLYQISKHFGSLLPVLDGICLDVLPGELVTILGPSGCGKTTLLRTVAGLEAPTSGKILIDGQDVTPLPTRERPIGMVFQSYALFPNMTVRQNIAFPLRVVKKPPTIQRERVNDLLALTQLEALAERYPHQLSGGQQQRTALARALAAAPKVLLLDEPLAALDAQVRQQLREELRRIQQTLRITTLFVTHDQGEALAIADRVAVMNHGRLEQIATPQDIYRTPTTRFSAAFIGSRNALELPVHQGRVRLGALLDLPATVSCRQALVFISPEDVVVGREGYPARVENLAFQGALTRLQLTLVVDGQTVQLAADMPSDQAGQAALGSLVGVTIRAEKVRIFPGN